MSNSETINQGDLPSIAGIIPAYNEAGKIGRVLEVVKQVPCLNEIIVIDDGSDDRTAAEVTLSMRGDPRIRLIRNEVNLGKGQAVLKGWKATSAEILLLLDADLIALTPQLVDALMRPVLSGEADMTIGVFRGGKPNTDFAHWATPWLSGQRCMLSRLFNDIPDEAAEGYGIETALTVAASMHEWKVVHITLRGVYHLPSEIHRGIGQGVLTRASMYWQIVKAWYVAGGVQVLYSHLHRKLVDGG